MEGIITLNDQEYYFTTENNVIFFNDTQDYNGFIPVENLTELFNPKQLDTPDFIVGRTFKRRNKIILKISNLNRTSAFQLRASIIYCLNLESQIEYVDSISITSNEITSINFDKNLKRLHNTLQDSTIKLEFERTDNDKFKFDLNNNKIEGEFSYNLDFNYESNIPAKVYSTLHFHFKETQDWNFLFELMRIYDEFICFMTNRSNHNDLKINLFFQKRRIGELIVPYFLDKTSNLYQLNKRIIPIKYTKNQLSSIFQLVAQQKIYISHIQERYKENDYLTPATIVMITAGFEWQFKFSDYPFEIQAIKIKEYQQDLLPSIENLILESTGDKKRYFKSLKDQLEDNIKNVTLEKRINYVLKKYWDMIHPFIAHLYGINGWETPKYSYIASSIVKARNNIAHGNISEPIDKKVGLNIMILEWIYFTMVLDTIEVPLNDIKKIINVLFARNFAIDD